MHRGAVVVRIRILGGLTQDEIIHHTQQIGQCRLMLANIINPGGGPELSDQDRAAPRDQGGIQLH